MDPDDTLLRRALLGNAVFSAASAGVMALWAPSLARLLGAVEPAVLYVVAGALSLFALDLVHQTRAGHVHPLRALGATAGDLLWVAGSGLLLLLWPELLTPEGKAVVAGVAAVVAAFAGLQLLGLARYARNQSGRTDAPSRYVLRRRLDAPAERVWQLLRRLDGIGRVYDRIHDVRVDEADGRTVRTCTAADGRRWSEEVVELDADRRSLVLRFRTEADDFPFPVRTLVGGWIARAREDGCELTLWYEFDLGWGAVGEIGAALIGPALEREMAPVLARIGQEAARAADRGRAPTGGAPAGGASAGGASAGGASAGSTSAGSPPAGSASTGAVR